MFFRKPTLFARIRAEYRDIRAPRHMELHHPDTVVAYKLIALMGRLMLNTPPSGMSR